MVQLYIREDLQGIHNLMSYMPEEMEDKLLNLRNKVMADKMDSLIQKKSFVVAVGTAHLPGKKGIIELLRERGYTVEPVFTTSRTHANNYSIKAEQKLVWTEVNEPLFGYKTKMPGKPNPSEMLNGAMKMNMYMDLASMKVYYAAFVIPGLTVSKQNADSALDAMCKNALSNAKGEVISKKRFVKDKFEGIDLTYKQPADNMMARVQILAMAKRIYMIGYISTRQDDLTSNEANDYFNAFTLLDMPVNPWEKQAFPAHYFSVSLPEKAKVTQLPVTDSSISSVQISSVDNAKGAFYGLTINTANQEYMITNDSIYFSSTIERLKNKMDMADIKERDTM
ncbi:MAG TPA: TraB/GumN family protein, partial [Chitinophagaceae bacterium]|nr:TraB/GumN family protein [Chitinophagaceae bacterium]